MNVTIKVLAVAPSAEFFMIMTESVLFLYSTKYAVGIVNDVALILLKYKS